MANSGDLILKKETLDGKVWRSTLPGMWAWLLQRVSAILILLFLVLHFFLPYRRPLQLLLLVIALHASGNPGFPDRPGAEVRPEALYRLFSWLLLACFSYGAICPGVKQIHRRDRGDRRI
jgi:hypothetical protein